MNFKVEFYKKSPDLNKPCKTKGENARTLKTKVDDTCFLDKKASSWKLYRGFTWNLQNISKKVKVLRDITRAYIWQHFKKSYFDMISQREH